jgi:hypothetical protein
VFCMSPRLSGGPLLWSLVVDASHNFFLHLHMAHSCVHGHKHSIQNNCYIHNSFSAHNRCAEGRFCMCLQCILIRFTPSIILLHSFFPFLEQFHLVSLFYFTKFTKYTKFINHICPPTPSPFTFPSHYIHNFYYLSIS